VAVSDDRSDPAVGPDQDPLGAAVGPHAGADPGSRRRRRLGELLVDAGVLSEADLARALGASDSTERLGATLIRLELASEAEIADAVAAQLALPRVDPAAEVVDPRALERVPLRIADRHEVLPLRLEGAVLVLATADPSDVVALDDVRTAGSLRSVRPVVATPTELRIARRRAYRSDVADEVMEEFEPEDTDPEDVGEDDDQPVIRLVNALLSDAVTARASDVHLEPDTQGLNVRVRVDGLLRHTRRLPRSLGRQVVSRLKIMAKVDIAERRLPQDGRAVTRVDGQEVDLRLSTMPTMHGETVVLRLLPKGADRVELEQLGLTATALRSLLDSLERPQGLVLVTGPTGSGKTSTLYAALAAAADPTRNVLTLEDPVEVQLEGVNQTQVDPRIGLTFARGLRHVLRQDPDVVLVGEIRDAETAKLAVEASFTGHLVLATLHTNDAPSAVARMIDLGADPFLVASSLLLVLAQRLARRVCARCATTDEPTPELVERLGLRPERLATATLRRGEGCTTCDDSGTLGRTAVSEVLPIDGTLRDLVVERASERQLAGQARRAGVRTLRADAIDRALVGTITLAEALRVTPDPG
jgi:type IV pilus assembly protein PilB